MITAKTIIQIVLFCIVSLESSASAADLAEREGFEPPSRKAGSGFQDRRNRPLCHLSSLLEGNELMPNAAKQCARARTTAARRSSHAPSTWQPGYSSIQSSHPAQFS